MCSTVSTTASQSASRRLLSTSNTQGHPSRLALAFCKLLAAVSHYSKCVTLRYLSRVPSTTWRGNIGGEVCGCGALCWQRLTVMSLREHNASQTHSSAVCVDVWSSIWARLMSDSKKGLGFCVWMCGAQFRRWAISWKGWRSQTVEIQNNGVWRISCITSLILMLVNIHDGTILSIAKLPLVETNLIGSEFKLKQCVHFKLF